MKVTFLFQKYEFFGSDSSVCRWKVFKFLYPQENLIFFSSLKAKNRLSPS